MIQLKLSTAVRKQSSDLIVLLEPQMSISNHGMIYRDLYPFWLYPTNYPAIFHENQRSRGVETATLTWRRQEMGGFSSVVFVLLPLEYPPHG